MAEVRRLDRGAAARLLGVTPDANAHDVRRAFRLWASALHPDAGGSESSFALLCEARAVLLEAVAPSAEDLPTAPPPRRPWRDVVIGPSPHSMLLLAAGLATAIAVVLVASRTPMPWGLVPAALGSACWCVAVSRVMLRGADHGHVIVMRSLAWLVATVPQVLLALGAGIPVLEALPLLAVPFVAVIAAVNPAAGLWRGASG